MASDDHYVHAVIRYHAISVREIKVFYKGLISHSPQDGVLMRTGHSFLKYFDAYEGQHDAGQK